jgi:cytochrome c oxidase subunit 4
VTGLGEGTPRSAGPIIRRNLLTWAALVAALALTCTLAYVPMGTGNAVVSLAIATFKTIVIALFFMELRRPDPLLRLTASAALLWIGFMFALTMADQRTRQPPTQPGTVTPEVATSPVTGNRLF